MEYNYLNQPRQNQHPRAEYVHPVPAHPQHGLYHQTLPPLPQPSQGRQTDYLHSSQGPRSDYHPTSSGQSLHPQYRHPASEGQEPMTVDDPRQVEMARNHNVITPSGLPATLHQPHVGYPVQTGVLPHQSTENPSSTSSQHVSHSSNVQVTSAHPVSSGTSSVAQQGPAVPTTNMHSVPVSNYETVESSAAHAVEQQPPSGNPTPHPPPGVSETGDASATDPAEKAQEDDSSLGGPLPEGLKYRKIGEKGVCVVAEEVISPGVRFGPFKGAFGKGPLHYNNMLSWELTLEGRVVGFLSPVKGDKAWMMFVRCADNPEEQTAEVGQYCGRIYFTTTREIQPGEELKVFYSDDYRESCGFKLALADLKYNAEIKSFECPFCPCHCSTSKSLLRHMKLFHHNEKRSTFDVTLGPTSVDTVPEKVASENADDDENGAKGQFFLCSICGRFFSTVGRLLSHKKIHTGEGSADSGEYICSLCGYVCLDSDTLAKHTENHKVSRHGCEQCGQVFKTREKMLEHKKDRHRLSKLVKIKLRVRKQPNACRTCGYMCSTEEALDEHVARHRRLPYGCPECGSMYKRKNTLLRHLRDKHSALKQRLRQAPAKAAETMEFRCNACLFNCPDAEHLAEHMEKHKIGPYGCDECGLVYTQKRFVARHKRDRHGAPLPANRRGLLSGNKLKMFPWACDECSKGYANLKSLRRHQKVKHGRETEPRYTSSNDSAEKLTDLDCYLCEATFTTESDFKKHLFRVHGMETLTSGEKKGGSVMVQSNVVQGAPCYICGQTFKKSSLLHDHLRQHHGIEAVTRRRGPQVEDATMVTEQPGPGPAPMSASTSGQIDMLGKPVDYYNRPRPFKCNECSRRFVNKNILKQHMLKFHVAGSKFNCSFCQKGFSQESQLLVHIQTHTKIRPFKCALCPRSFASQSAYNNHQGEHTGEKPHKCDVCGRGFRTPKQVSKHKRRVHSNKEKPHKCSFCEKRFLSRRDHEIHERRHKGIRPFVCLTCGKAFKDKNSRKVHYRIHTGEKPFPCPYCGKAFAQSHALTDHMVMHTKENMQQTVAVSSLLNN